MLPHPPLSFLVQDGSEGTALDNVAAKAVTEAKRLLSEKFQNFLKLGLAKQLTRSWWPLFITHSIIEHFLNCQ